MMDDRDAYPFYLVIGVLLVMWAFGITALIGTPDTASAAPLLDMVR